MAALRFALASFFLSPLLLAAPTTDNTKNPISVKSAELLGNQTSNIPGVWRDVGYAGSIGKTNFRVYADTMLGDPSDAGKPTDLGTFAANNLALSTSDPKVVKDFSDKKPPVTCDTKVEGMRLHLTSLVPLSGTEGVVFYANISQDKSIDIDGAALGAGVAKITYEEGGVPRCEVLPQFWGEDQPMWGDHDATSQTLDGYIYLFGQPGAKHKSYNESEVYSARVPRASVTSKDKYEFWDGSKWNPTFKYSKEAVVLKGGQGSISYNRHYNRYVYLHPGPPLSGEIMARTAQMPNGPWTEPVTVYKAKGMIYAPVAQSYFDDSGKTLIFDLSVFSPMYIQTVKLTFN